MSQTVTYTIPAMHCDHCVHTIQMEVGDIAGVTDVKAALDGRTATITFEPPASEAQIIDLLKEIYYPPEGHDKVQIA